MDYYQILGIPQNSSQSDIRSKFKNLALKYHPDRNSKKKNKNHEIIFKNISSAYQVLSDPKKRLEYDKSILKNKYENNSKNNHFKSYSHPLQFYFTQNKHQLNMTFSNLPFSNPQYSQPSHNFDQQFYQNIFSKTNFNHLPNQKSTSYFSKPNTNNFNFNNHNIQTNTKKKKNNNSPTIQNPTDVREYQKFFDQHPYFKSSNEELHQNQSVMGKSSYESNSDQTRFVNNQKIREVIVSKDDISNTSIYIDDILNKEIYEQKKKKKKIKKKKKKKKKSLLSII